MSKFKNVINHEIVNLDGLHIHNLVIYEGWIYARTIPDKNGVSYSMSWGVDFSLSQINAPNNTHGKFKHWRVFWRLIEDEQI